MLIYLFIQLGLKQIEGTVINRNGFTAFEDRAALWVLGVNLMDSTGGALLAVSDVMTFEDIGCGQSVLAITARDEGLFPFHHFHTGFSPFGTSADTKR